MILKTKDAILNWLEKYDHNYRKSKYYFIALWAENVHFLLNKMNKKYQLSEDFFEKFKKEEH